MENFDNVLVIDADGHVYEGNVDLTSRMPEKVALAGAGAVEGQRRQFAHPVGRTPLVGLPRPRTRRKWTHD